MAYICYLRAAASHSIRRWPAAACRPTNASNVQRSHFSAACQASLASGATAPGAPTALVPFAHPVPAVLRWRRTKPARFRISNKPQAASGPASTKLPGTELAKRLGLTMLLICLARMGHFIPVPGVQWQAAGGGAAIEFLMGRSQVAANVFVLGIAPLMTAYFVLAAANLIPDIRRHFAALREEGPRGRDTYNSYATALFIGIACWEGTSLARSWLPLRIVQSSAHPAAVEAAVAAAAGNSTGSMFFMLCTMVLLTAGSAICKLITQVVEQHGLGDGTGLLIALGVAVNYAHFLQVVAMQLAVAPPNLVAAALVAAMCASLIAVSLWAQSVEIRLPITFYRARRSIVQSQQPMLALLSSKFNQQGHAHIAPNQPAKDGKQQCFPMRLSPVGARSLLFANFWVSLLEGPLSWLGLGNPFQTAIGFAVLVLVIEGVTIADMTPRQMSQFLAGSDAGIHGISPGDETMNFFTVKRQQLKLLNAALLAVLSLGARAVDAASLALIGVPVGCLSLLLLASTVASGARQVEALSRAPTIECLVAREQAAAGLNINAADVPESRWKNSQNNKA